MTVGFFHAGESATHRALARLLVKSVHKTMPGVEVVQFTDRETPPMLDVDRCLRRPPAPIALACLEAYASVAGDWLFVDTDVIVRRDVRHVFDEAFDIAVADRAGTLLKQEVGTKFMRSMPYNKGAVFSRTPAFWRAAVARAHGYSPARQAWMGDQLAMNDVIRAGGFRVRVLASAYNYPPKTRADVRGDQAILHYKGPRKVWLTEGLA